MGLWAIARGLHGEMLWWMRIGLVTGETHGVIDGGARTGHAVFPPERDVASA
jgi:hypothetical protein